MTDPLSNLIEVPGSFTERFLWTPCLTTAISSSSNPQCSPTDLDGSLSSYQFSDETVEEFQALLSRKLWSTSQPTIAIPPESEPVNILTGFTVHCPITGANDVIDSLVRLVAARVQADVLVLDALELAAGQFGALGKSARVIETIYEAGSTSKEPDSDESQDPNIDQNVQRFFDALMDIESKPIPSGKGTDYGPNDSGPRRRIIYLRDFGSIARAAKPLMISILEAINNCSRKGNPRALVMGVTGSKKSSKVSDSDSGSDSSSGLFRRFRRRLRRHRPAPKTSVALGARRERLRQTIPSIENEYPVLEDYASSTLLNPMGAEMFLSSSVDSELQYKTLNINPTRERTVDSFIPNQSILNALPMNAQGQDFREKQQNITRARMNDINYMLLRIHIGKLGGITCHSLFHEILAEASQKSSQDNLPSSILNWSTANSIANTAIGLACMESPGAIAPIAVSSGDVARAYQLFVHNDVAEAEWEEEEEKVQSPRKDEGGDAEEHEQEKDRNESDAKQPENDIIKSVKGAKDLSREERMHLGCIVDIGSFPTRFDGVCVDPAVKENIRTVISLPLLYPAYFKKGLLSREYITGVLLYGPPGTGKTMLCRALANECGARMLLVKPSDILECLVGESEKKIIGLFSLACRLAPCVMFIDEVDALFSARGEDTKSHRRDMLVEFMQAMDGLLSAGENRKKGLVIVGATNRPFDLDEAILRRLPCRMLVDLPSKTQRLKILNLLLKDETLHSDVDLFQVAQETEEYSGSDLKSLCVAAALASVRTTIGQIDWKSGANHAAGNRTPKASLKNSEDSADIGPPSVIRRVHFDQARSTVFPAFSEKASSRLYRWHEKFAAGTGGQCMLPPKVGSNATCAPANEYNDGDIDNFVKSVLGKKA